MPGAQPRPTLADQLERITPRLDELTARVRLGLRTVRDFDDAEHDAQAIGAALIAAFRGPAARAAFNRECSRG